ncbi:NAD-dependent dehydratase [Rhodoplanes elegans]|uniref:NAD-dependent dehydratase n=1 Tax=Rhodoplanes elegans TaxID=29408 RepID=A0A327KIM8_9BRAD|nr:NAD-dependent epimerase/dehydratase family protein [Rhodoplanes elegans]MBK5961881.1 NAD-dependent dehydratase [Rhodoplanes elegans]RAI38659.1 NAD-dependent dehydratase [Rhodoplanes elegans]
MRDIAVVCGAGGFIGGYLVKRLKADGYWVRGVDVKFPAYERTAADDYLLLDLRDPIDCARALRVGNYSPKEVYQLAGKMGGIEFIESEEYLVLTTNALINLNMINAAAAAHVSRYFFPSSVAVYRDMSRMEAELREEGAYPAMPDNDYGWEKLFSERVVSAFQKRFGAAVRIGRFQNCYGPGNEWKGGRENSLAALCRKIALANDGETIKVFGDGSAVRNFIFIEDAVEAIISIMRSDVSAPVNVGTREYITISDLVDIIARIAEKVVKPRFIEGPTGVRFRRFSTEQIEMLGWKARNSLQEGLRLTYDWIRAEALEDARRQIVDI